MCCHAVLSIFREAHPTSGVLVSQLVELHSALLTDDPEAFCPPRRDSSHERASEGWPGHHRDVRRAQASSGHSASSGLTGVPLPFCWSANLSRSTRSFLRMVAYCCVNRTRPRVHHDEILPMNTLRYG